MISCIYFHLFPICNIYVLPSLCNRMWCTLCCFLFFFLLFLFVLSFEDCQKRQRAQAVNIALKVL